MKEKKERQKKSEREEREEKRMKVVLVGPYKWLQERERKINNLRNSCWFVFVVMIAVYKKRK
jgi:hypothetical protein